MSTPPAFPRAVPRLALVVGSGGVRGVAAIGVADILEREGLRVDLVAGCSSGALFGATVAMGMPAYHALRAATDFWRAELTEQRRWKAYAQLVAPRLLGFGADFAMRDPGLIRKTLDAAFGDLRIERLPLQFRVAATEADTGRGVVLSSGRVADAVLASMAVPFLFPSVVVDGKRLVDGVLSDPLPVSAASDASAVVALGFEGSMPRRVDRPSRLVAQFTTSLTNNLQEARLEAARASGQAVLSLDLKLDRRVGLWETEAMPYLFQAGRAAAISKLRELHALLDGRRPAPVAHRDPEATSA